jgi:hypothetical protein
LIYDGHQAPTEGDRVTETEWKKALALVLDNEGLKRLCVRAAEALETSSPLIGAEDDMDKLIAELRKAAK